MRVLLDGNLPRSVVLRARTNSLPDLAPLADAILQALGELAPGELRIVGG